MSNERIKIKQVLEKNIKSESDYIYLLSLIRRAIESMSKPDAKTYDYLKMFCDWSLHTKIDRSKIGTELIKKIHKIINLKKDSPANQVIKEISKALLENLQNQIRLFLEKEALPLVIVNEPQEWRLFLKNLFEILENNRIILPSKHHVSISLSPLKKGMWVTEIEIIKINFSALNPIKVKLNNQTYCLSILTSNTTKIIIPLSASYH